jgi:hypothetical protein
MTETASEQATLDPTEDAQARLVQFVRSEALAACERLVTTLASSTPPAVSELAAALSDSRVVRGSTAMAGLIETSAVAGHLERILKALHGRRLSWTAVLADTVRTAAGGLLDLVEAIPAWGAESEHRARALTAELARYDVGRRPHEPEMIVPIGRLFHSDSGPHVLFVPANPQTEFEQQLRALARWGAPSGALPTPPDAGTAMTTPPAPVARIAPSPGGLPRVETRAATRPSERIGRRQTPTAPRGSELRALLDRSVTAMNASFGTETSDPVPIEQLLYSGRSALQRAREVAKIIRARGPENSRELLPELIDLLELAGSG